MNVLLDMLFHRLELHTNTVHMILNYELMQVCTYQSVDKSSDWSLIDLQSWSCNSIRIDWCTTHVEYLGSTCLTKIVKIQNYEPFTYKCFGRFCGQCKQVSQRLCMGSQDNDEPHLNVGKLWSGFVLLSLCFHRRFSDVIFYICCSCPSSWAVSHALGHKTGMNHIFTFLKKINVVNYLTIHMTFNFYHSVIDIFWL